ncbi:MAG: collagen-like protein, partial [Pseudomonadota bacterium]
MLKRSIIALSLLTILTGCSLDGDDGKDGLQGEQGPAGLDGTNGSDGTNGTDGANGTDANAALSINLIGRAVLNAESPEGAAEIVAYQASKKRIFAINSSGDSAVVNIIKADSFDRTALVKDNEGVINGTNLVPEITLALNENSAGDANSIAIDANNELLAVAMAADNTGDAGLIAFYDISGDQPQFIKNVSVGALPDMVTFSHDGNKVLVANEGEPNGDYSVDPEGSISIINITNGVIADTAISLTFTAYNDKQAELEELGIVFANPTGRTINGKLINT